jgi:hypothetical protein
MPLPISDAARYVTIRMLLDSYVQHTSSIPTSVRNSNIHTQDLPSVNLPIRVIIHTYIHTGSYSRRTLYRVSQEDRSIFWEVIVSIILSKKVYMYMCPIRNGFRDRAISFIHTLHFRPQCIPFIISLSFHYMFRPYTAIIRCHYLLELFHCVACAASPITCKCDISHLKQMYSITGS